MRSIPGTITDRAMDKYLPRATDMGRFEILNQIIEFEEGNLDHNETIAMVQALIDNGMAWTLQGTYGRMAAHFIEEGLCHA